ncbi:MAG: Bax inhibitor-1/YccA family protein [Deltaproteobacteria bacterium]|nr:Bax inhibitor-1/YccA family protein [Deltaproteobacteria bacterium]
MNPGPNPRGPYIDPALNPAETGERVDSAMRNVYWWMTAGLAVTAIVAMAVFRSDALMQLLYENRWIIWGSFLVELGLVIGLTAAIKRLSNTAAMAMFMVYAALNGFTLSLIFMAYTAGSIAGTFVATAGTFGVMALYGTVTKRDLTGMGSFLFMGLIGLIIASVVNIFLASPMLYWGITYLGILIFVGLTAYDVQKLRRLAAAGELDSEKMGIFGALILYLDFINLFLLLLRVMGDRR